MLQIALTVLVHPVGLNFPMLGAVFHLGFGMPPRHQGIDNLDFVPEPNRLGPQHRSHVGTSIPMATATTHTASMPMCAVPAEATTPLVTAHSAPPPGFESGSASSKVYSPIDVSRLANVLYHHPDRALTQFLLHGFTHGFDIGYRGPITAGSSKNLFSARSHAIDVTAALNKEVSRGHTLGPYDVPPFPILHVSPLGAVEKKDSTYRIILDLSSPKGQAVNDGIDQADYSVRYSSFDDAVDLVHSLGPGSTMAKIDIKHAFRLCPVRPQDYQLLGMCWNGKYYIDTRLPFGSRSSPFIFNSFADALAWILIFVCGVPHVLHYLDDFFIAAPRCSGLCQSYINDVKNMFSYLGVPIAEEKLQGPTTCITYLGIEIDSNDMATRLPEEKLHEIKLLLSDWVTKRKCSKRQLLSLIGKLSFAAKVVKPGRLFLRRLIDLSKTVSKLQHMIHMDSEAREDILWWHKFVSTWNGVSIIQTPMVTSDEFTLFTDASGSLGFGAIYRSHWFSCSWPSHLQEYHINFKELFAIVAAVKTWGHNWPNKQILIFTDSKVVSDSWKSRSSKNPAMMCLLRHMFFHAAKYNFNVMLQHLPGHDNHLADLLSRLQVSKFQQAAPSMDAAPTILPPEVWSF